MSKIFPASLDSVYSQSLPTGKQRLSNEVSFHKINTFSAPKSAPTTQYQPQPLGVTNLAIFGGWCVNLAAVEIAIGSICALIVLIDSLNFEPAKLANL